MLEQLRHVLEFLRRERLYRIFFLLLFLTSFSAFALELIEPDRAFGDWLWWSIVTLTTVGYGDITPSSLWGRVIGIGLMFCGIGVVGVFTATVAGVFIEKRFKRERGMGTYKFKCHVILCGWNHRARDILHELRSDERCARTPIVLLAETDMKPVDDADLHFISGSVTEENLKRANVQDATTVVILGDDALEANARDAKVVLSTLTVETFNPEAYTIVELVNKENVQHCERARADEVIVGSEFSSCLIASATLDHGITKVLSEVLSSRSANALMKVQLPAALDGHEFLEVISEMKRLRNSIVLAVQRGKQVVTNPATDFKVEANDHLIVITDGKI